MADIEQLGIAVDTSQTKLAARELDNLAAAGAKAEGSTKKLGSTSKQAMEQAAAATAKAQQTMERMLAAQERQEKLMEQMAREMQQLNQALQGNASANNAAAQAAQNAAQALGQESAAAKSAQAAAQGHAQAATSAAAASGAMGAQATATGGALGGMASKVLATATAVLSLGKIISEMDAWTNMNNRIRLVTEGQEQFATAQANIISIANATRQPLAETASLYQKMANNQKELGLSGTELAGVVKTISQSMVIGSGAVQGNKAALEQLGQAFSSGVLRGEEFNTMMEQAPGFMQALSAGMGKTVGQMRALAEAGALTATTVIQALQKQESAVDANFAKMGSTIGQSGTVFNNKMLEFIGRMDDATGISKVLANGVLGLSDNIGALATIAATLVGVGLATWIGSAVTAAGGLAVALSGVAAASTGLLAAMGPAGWLILGVGAAATAWQLLGSKASTAGAQMSSAGEQAAAAGNKLVAGIVPAINTAIGAYDKMIAKQKESMGIAKTPIDDAAKALKEADLNLQKLAQQVARAQQGSGEYVNMGPKQRAAAEKALTDELEKASKKRGELAAKEAEYNSNVVAQYVKGKERQTDASAKLLAIEEAKEKRDKALAAAGYDRARQEQVNSAYRVELAKIEESSAKKASSAVSAATRETSNALKEQNNAYADLAGVSSTYYKEMEGYQAQRAKGNITEAQYVELVEKLIQKQPFAVALTKAQTEAFKEQEDARKKAYDATEKAFQQEVETAQKSAKAAQEKVGQLSDEAKAIEISKAKHITLAEAMEEVIVKRLEDRLESAKQADSQELLDAIAAEIKARKELGQALGDREVREAADDAAKYAGKSWQYTAKKINGDLTDAIIAGFEGGKNGAQALKDSLVKMFEDMVLRPVISAIVAPVSGMLSSGAQSMMGGVGGGGGGIFGSLAGSAAGTFFSGITTAVSAGFKGATLGVGMMGPTTAGAGGAMGFGNALAAIPGWGLALAGIAALAGLGIGKTPGEQHQGGIYSSSGKTDMDTAMRVTGGGGWDDGAWARDLTDRADAAIGSSLEKVGTGLIDIFEQVNALAGGVADEFELTLGFAANLNGEGKDKNAFGYFDLTDKTTGEVITSYQNRELGTDTGAAMTKLTNDAARAMLDALAKADVPQWAQNVLQELEEVPGLQAMQEFLAYPQKLADSFGIAQESMAGAIAEGFKTGDGEAAGQALAQTVLSGIQNSIIGAASQQISTLVTNVILTPILDALANSQDPAEALAAIDFDAVIAQAEGIGEGLATVLNNPALQAAMDKIDATLQQVGQSAVGAAGNLQLIATAADQVADAPVPETPAEPMQQAVAGSKFAIGGSATGGWSNEYQRMVFGISDMAKQTSEALQKIADSLKSLGKTTVNAYEEINAQARKAFSERGGHRLEQSIAAAETEKSKLPKLQNLRELVVGFGKTGSFGDFAESAKDLFSTADMKMITSLMEQASAEFKYGSGEWEQYLADMLRYVDGASFVANKGGENLSGLNADLNILNKEIREWAIAQKRLIATDELVNLATETASARKEIENLELTGGIENPINKLKEKYRLKLNDINEGINKALSDEIYANQKEIEKSQEFLLDKNIDLYDLQKISEFVGVDNNMLTVGGIPNLDIIKSYLEKKISELQENIDVMTSEQKKYINAIEEWYDSQKELLSTQMLVDINKQITALEAEEKGPLTTIKDAIQKYADDFEALGTLTADVQAQLDKLSGLQLDQARTSLYDQLLSQEERRAKEQEKLNAAFTELGATTPASTDALRAMIDAARDAGNVGLADSLLELVPAFVALQGAADGAGSALDRAMQDVDKAFAALQRSINAEKDRINADAQAQIDAINAGAEAREKAIDDARQQVQDLGGIFDDITKAVKTLRGNAQDEAMQMEQARAYISMALSVAQAGGTVDREKLREAMGTVTKDNAQSYITGADYRFSQARQAAELQALADITGEQKDVAQATLDAALEANKAAQEQIDAIIEARDKQLKALDDQLKAAQEQIDVMNGIDISVLGVGDAVIAFDTAMATYQSEKSRIDAENLALQAAIDEKIKQQKEQDLEICIMQVDAINQMSSDIVSAIGSIPAPVQPPPSSSGPVITYDGAQGPGLYVNGGLTGGIMPKFPSFDVGTNYVPNDMIAQIHEGEAIVPKEFNPAAFGGVKTDDAQLASLVVSLTTEVQRLQTIVKAGNDEQRRTADAVNGRPEAPMLVETV